MSVAGRTEVLVLDFDLRSGRFEGHVLGALERAEAGGAIRLVEAALVARDPDAGDLAVLLARGDAGSLVAALTSFRLDPGRRRSATSAALAASDPEEAEALRALASRLEPGGATMVVRLEHCWTTILADALGRTGGRLVADELEVPRASGGLAARGLALLAGTA